MGRQLLPVLRTTKKNRLEHRCLLRAKTAPVENVLLMGNDGRLDEAVAVVNNVAIDIALIVPVKS